MRKDHSSQIFLSAAILFLLVFMMGCQPSGRSAREEPILVQWPSPPEPPRIRFLYSFSASSDLGIRGSFLSWLTGKHNVHQLRRPVAVTVGSKNTIYVADLSGSIYMFNVEKKIAKAQTSAVNQPLLSPVSMVLLPGDSLYVIDSALRKMIVYDPELNPVHDYDLDLERPSSILYDSIEQCFYIADAGTNRIITLDSKGQTRELIGADSPNPISLNTPTHMCIKQQNLYVTDAFNFNVKVFESSGVLMDSFGQPGKTVGSFARPKGVAVDSDGHVYVVDALFGNVQIFDNQGSLLLFFGETADLKPGGFALPNGIFIDDQDVIYVADTYHGAIQVFQYLSGEG